MNIAALEFVGRKAYLHSLLQCKLKVKEGNLGLIAEVKGMNFCFSNLKTLIYTSHKICQGTVSFKKAILVHSLALTKTVKFQYVMPKISLSC